MTRLAQPHLFDMLCATPGAGDIDFDVPTLDEIAQPASFD